MGGRPGPCGVRSSILGPIHSMLGAPPHQCDNDRYPQILPPVPRGQNHPWWKPPGGNKTKLFSPLNITSHLSPLGSMAIQIWVGFYVILCSFERRGKKITPLLEKFRNVEFFLGGSSMWLSNTSTGFEYVINWSAAGTERSQHL